MKITKTESELKAAAREISEQLTVRYYTDRCGRAVESCAGTSHDVRRPTTEAEAEIIYNVAYGALLEINYDARGDARKAVSTAEWIVKRFLPNVNAYDTVFVPLMQIVRDWETEAAA